jgi:hypothetical protein
LKVSTVSAGDVVAGEDSTASSESKKLDRDTKSAAQAKNDKNFFM